MITTTTKNTACVPTPLEDIVGDRRWMSQHERFISERKRQEPNVVFIGDSLIQLMQLAPVWKEQFEPLHCLNFAIGGDQTQHVLWRIVNGTLDFEIKPKVVVLLVGTNNLNHTAEQVAEGVLHIVSEIRHRLTTSHVLVLAIPPRGRDINVQREKIVRINEIVEKGVQQQQQQQAASSGDRFTHFLACSRWHELINAQDGTISHADMYDYLHFTNEGYAKFCEPIVEQINQLLSLSRV